MDRRDSILALLSFGVAPGLACAQQQRRTPRIGLLSGAASAAEFPEKQTLESLRELGLIDGKNVAIESRFAESDPALLAKYAAELVRINVDVIVTFSVGVNAFKQATKTIPVVFASRCRSRGRHGPTKSNGGSGQRSRGAPKPLSCPLQDSRSATASGSSRSRPRPAFR